MRCANATELAALAGLGGPEYAMYKIRLARSPLADGLRSQELFSVNPGQQRIFAEAADYLRTQQPRLGVVVQGIVVRLARDSRGTTSLGEVVIQGADDDKSISLSCRLWTGTDRRQHLARAGRLLYALADDPHTSME